MHATLIPILMSVALPGPPADRDEAVAVVQIDRILNAKQWIPCGRAFSIGLVDVSVVRVESGALPAAQIIVAIPCPVDGGYRAGFRFRVRLAARRPPAWTMRVADLHQEIPDDRVVRYARSAEPVCDGGLVDLAAVLQAGACRLPRSSRSPDAAAADALAIGIEPERAAANLGRGFPLVVSLRNSTARPSLPKGHSTSTEPLRSTPSFWPTGATRSSMACSREGSGRLVRTSNSLSPSSSRTWAAICLKSFSSGPNAEMVVPIPLHTARAAW